MKHSLKIVINPLTLLVLFFVFITSSSCSSSKKYTTGKYAGNVWVKDLRSDNDYIGRHLSEIKKANNGFTCSTWVAKTGEFVYSTKEGEYAWQANLIRQYNISKDSTCFFMLLASKDNGLINHICKYNNKHYNTRSKNYWIHNTVNSSGKKIKVYVHKQWSAEHNMNTIVYADSTVAFAPVDPLTVK